MSFLSGVLSASTITPLSSISTSFLSLETKLWEREAKQLEQKEQAYEVLGKNELLNIVYAAIMPDPNTCSCLRTITTTVEEVKAPFSIVDEVR